MINKIRRYYERACTARAETGKSITQQSVELLKLRRTPNKISPSEYFEFQLYDDALYSETDRKAFIGYNAYNIYSKLNRRGWDGVANDKLIFCAVMCSSGFSVPENHAVLSYGGRRCNEAQVVRGEEEFHCFLKERRDLLPFFYKPVHGVFGRGSGIIRDYDARKRRVILHNTSKNIADLLESFKPSMNDGILIQSVLRPSDSLRALVGERLATTRFIVWLGDDGLEILAVNWKIPAGDNIVCNTDGWTNGNLVAIVDRDTGDLLRICAGEGGVAVECSGIHPDTKADLRGVRVPEFESQKEYVLAAAKQFPGIRLQAWDMVSTDKGEIALEVNLVTESTVHGCQLVGRRGLLSTTLERELLSLERGKR